MNAKEACELRISKIRSKMNNNKLDALYVRVTTNIAWASAFTGVFDEEMAHALLILPDKVILHTDSRYSAAMRKTAEGTSIEVFDILEPHFDFFLKNHLAHHGSKLKIGIEDSLSLREFHAMEKSVEGHLQVKLIETSNFVEELRARKDDLEIASMRKAQAITDAAFTHICSFIKPGISELDVQRELDRYMYQAGSCGLAFPSIVAAGPHAASPHAQPSERLLEEGDAVVMDFGARVDGYCSDMTRTVFLGEPDKELAHAYSVLRKANEECEAKVKAGVRASLVHNHAEKVLARSGFANKMGHSLGHSLGLDIHEAPTLSWKNDKELEEGVVITVEPGIYLDERFGMRLEDFGVVRQDGFEVLTKSTHEMVIINVRD